MKMRLSEAIRLGAIMKPQAFGMIFDGIGTCAIGAAKDAVGELDVSPAWFGIAEVFERHPEWHYGILRCPVSGCSHIEGVIAAHLNDYHRWTRERIADFIEQIERERGLWPASAEVKQRVETAV
jgi:hypothetical protein